MLVAFAGKLGRRWHRRSHLRRSRQSLEFRGRLPGKPRRWHPSNADGARHIPLEILAGIIRPIQVKPVLSESKRKTAGNPHKIFPALHGADVMGDRDKSSQSESGAILDAELAMRWSNAERNASRVGSSACHARGNQKDWDCSTVDPFPESWRAGGLIVPGNLASACRTIEASVVKSHRT